MVGTMEDGGYAINGKLWKDSGYAIKCHKRQVMESEKRI
jgi:hypothetical protein